MYLERCYNKLIQSFVDTNYVSGNVYNIVNVSYILYGDFDFTKWQEENKHGFFENLTEENILDVLSKYHIDTNDKSAVPPFLFPTGFFNFKNNSDLYFHKKNFTDSVCYRINNSNITSEQSYGESEAAIMMNTSEVYRTAYKMLNYMINHRCVSINIKDVLHKYYDMMITKCVTKEEYQLVENLLKCENIFQLKNLMQNDMDAKSVKCGKCSYFDYKSVFRIYNKFKNIKTEKQPFQDVFNKECLSEVMYTLNVFKEYNGFNIEYDPVDNTVYGKRFLYEQEGARIMTDVDETEDDENDEVEDDESSVKITLEREKIINIYDKTLSYTTDFDTYKCSVVMFKRNIWDIMKCIELLRSSTNILENCYYSTMLEFYTNMNMNSSEKFNVVAAILKGMNGDNYNILIQIFKNMMNVLMTYVTPSNFTKISYQKNNMTNIYEFVVDYVVNRVSEQTNENVNVFITKMAERINVYMMVQYLTSFVNFKKYNMTNNIYCDRNTAGDVCYVENRDEGKCGQQCETVLKLHNVYDFITSYDLDALKESNTDQIINYLLFKNEYRTINFLRMAGVC